MLWLFFFHRFHQLVSFTTNSLKSLSLERPPVARPHVGSINPPPTCHFLPQGRPPPPDVMENRRRCPFLLRH